MAEVMKAEVGDTSFTAGGIETAPNVLVRFSVGIAENMGETQLILTAEFLE